MLARSAQEIFDTAGSRIEQEQATGIQWLAKCESRGCRINESLGGAGGSRAIDSEGPSITKTVPLKTFAKGVFAGHESRVWRQFERQRAELPGMWIQSVHDLPIILHV